MPNLGSIGEVFVEVGADLKNLQSQLSGAVPQAAAAGQRTGDAFGKTAAEGIQKATASLKDFGMQAATAGAVLTAELTIPLVGLATAALSMSSKIELAGAAFTHMLGSAQAAGAFLKELKQFALETPFNFPELVPMTQRLRAFGFAAEEVIPTLRSIGDAVGLLGAGTETMNRIALALGQMQVSSRLTAQDMRQLEQAGINAWKYLAEAANTSVAEIKAISETAGLNGAAAARLIIQGMNKEFAGGMQQLTQTLSGQWAKVKEQISFALGDIGDALAPFARQAIDLLSDKILPAIREMVTAFRELPQGVQAAIVALGAVAAAAGPLLAALGGISLALGAIAGAAPILVPVAATIGAIGAALATIKLTGLDLEFRAFFDSMRLNFIEIKRQLVEFSAAVGSLVPSWVKEIGNFVGSITDAITGMARWKDMLMAAIPGLTEIIALMRTATALATYVGGRSTARDQVLGAGSALGSSALATSTADQMSAQATAAIAASGGEAGLQQRQLQREIDRTNQLLAQLFKTGKDGAKDAAKATKAYSDSLVDIGNAMEAIQGSKNPLLAMRDEMAKAMVDANKLAKALSDATFAIDAAMADVNESIAKNVKSAAADLVDAKDALLGLAAAVKESRPEIVRLGEEYKQFGITSLDALMKQADALRTAEQRAVALQRPLFDVLQITKQRLETELKIAEASDGQQKRAQELKGQLDGVNNQLDKMTGHQKNIIDLGAEMSKTFALTWDRMAQGIAASITGAQNLGQVFTGVFRSIRDALIEMVVKAFLVDLQNAILGNVQAVSQLAASFKSLGTFIQRMFGGAGAAGSGAAGSAAGSAASATGSLLSVMGVVGSIGNLVTGLLSFFQGRRMEQDIGRIEVTTRGMLNESLNRRADAWSQHNDIMGKWDLLLDGLTAGVFAINGGGGGGGGGSRRGTPADGDGILVSRGSINRVPPPVNIVAPVQDLTVAVADFSSTAAAAIVPVNSLGTSLDDITKSVTKGNKSYDELKQTLATADKGSQEYADALDQLKDVQDSVSASTRKVADDFTAAAIPYVNAGKSLLGSATAASVAGSTIQRAGTAILQASSVVSAAVGQVTSAVTDLARRAGIAIMPDPLGPTAPILSGAASSGGTSSVSDLQYLGGTFQVNVYGGVWGPDSAQYFGEQLTEILRREGRLG